MDGSCLDFECISRKTQQGIGGRALEYLLEDERSSFDRSPLASSLQPTFNATWLAYTGGCRT